MADNFKGEDSMVALHPIIPEGERKKDLTSRLNEISSGYILDFNADLGLTQPGAPELEKVQEMVLARYKSSELVNKEVDDRDYNVIQPLDGSLDKIYKTSIAAPQEERAKWGKLLTLVNSPSQIEEAGATFGEEEKTALYTSAANFHLAIAEMAFDCAGECPTPKYEHLQTALEFYQALGIQGQEGYTTVKALQKVNAVE